jgi:hypothetical protein
LSRVDGVGLDASIPTLIYLLRLLCADARRAGAAIQILRRCLHWQLCALSQLPELPDSAWSAAQVASTKRVRLPGIDTVKDGLWCIT